MYATISSILMQHTSLVAQLLSVKEREREDDSFIVLFSFDRDFCIESLLAIQYKISKNRQYTDQI